MTKINKSGVILGGEKIVLAAGSGYSASVTVAQHPKTGLWAYGIDVAAGRVAVDSFRFGYAPSAARAKSESREDAIDFGRDAVLCRYEEHIKWASQGGQSKINPSVGRAIARACKQIYSKRQLLLFQLGLGDL